MAQRLMVDPNEYWRRDQGAKSQRLYVGFCEFASAALDWATGQDLLLRGRDNHTRLNWASTALYYSLVHAVRLVVFLPMGDFPMRHKPLACCLSFEGAKTDWLKNFAPRVSESSAGPQSEYSARVVRFDLESYWSRAVGRTDIEASLKWLGSILNEARALRNENNYEALLIAHEYQHRDMTKAFRQLAEAMAQGATRALALTAQWFGSYLSSAGDPTLDCEIGARLSFVTRYTRRRILEPIITWYRQVIASEIKILLQPVVEHKDVGDRFDGAQIEEDVARDVFGGKENLMADFEAKIRQLTYTVQHPAGPGIWEGRTSI